MNAEKSERQGESFTRMETGSNNNTITESFLYNCAI